MKITTKNSNQDIKNCCGKGKGGHMTFLPLCVTSIKINMENKVGSIKYQKAA